MLSSINPLGERARRQSYPLTLVAYIFGSMVGGGLLGFLGGVVGDLLPNGDWRLGLLAGIAVAGAVLDWTGRKPPSVHRQVNEDWLTRYRGWVYGVGFGFQLGLGLITIVTTAAIYVMVALVILAGSPLLGLLTGVTFGLARAGLLLKSAHAQDGASLRALFRRLQDGLSRANRFVVAAQAIVAVAACGILLGA